MMVSVSWSLAALLLQNLDIAIIDGTMNAACCQKKPLKGLSGHQFKLTWVMQKDNEQVHL